MKNREYLDDKGPKIIIANHPNTLMDAWILGYVCNRRVYYMTKGTFFTSPLKRWVLNGLGMIPVNRKADGVSSGVSNEDSFEACYRLLEEGETLVVFPEGSSFQGRLLRKLKSGAARIAIQTELRNEGGLGLKIFPVGLNYIRPEKFGGSVLATIGEPISPLPYLEEFKTDSLKAARKLTEQLTMGLSRLIVRSEQSEEEELVEGIVDIISSDYIKSESKGVERDVEVMRSVFDQMNVIRISQPWKIEEIKMLVESINWQIDNLNIKSDFLDRKYRSTMFKRQLVQSILFLVLGFPIFLYGFIHNIFQFKITDFIVVKAIKEVEYTAPILVLLGLIFYPCVYLLFMFGFDFIFELEGWMKCTYYWSMPLTGLAAHYYYQYYKHVLLKRKFIFLMRRNKNDIETLKKERESLKKLVFEI
ncbi:MAG: 1-acyl-sn-glycerol-3-phosphate acyltransferase [Crocinitomicaceae bacterium]|nr:1-acyl-sn-glycerol-3-phosphate acyltransferase [Crocinitomicaceae bacterium]